ncbi:MULTISPECIES: hypothetical protein [unclassified Undibacterium]
MHWILPAISMATLFLANC